MKWDTTTSTNWAAFTRWLRDHVVMRRLLLTATSYLSMQEFQRPLSSGLSWAQEVGFLLRQDQYWLKQLRHGSISSPKPGQVYFDTPAELVHAARRIDRERSEFLLGMTQESALENLSLVQPNDERVVATRSTLAASMINFAAEVMERTTGVILPREYQFQVARSQHDLALFLNEVDRRRISSEQGVEWETTGAQWDENQCHAEIKRRLVNLSVRNNAIWALIRKLSDQQFFEISEAMNDSLFHALNRYLAEMEYLIDACERPDSAPLDVESRYLPDRAGIERWWMKIEARREELANRVKPEDMFVATVLRSDPWGDVKLQVFQLLDRMAHQNSYTTSGVLRNVGRFGLKEELLHLVAPFEGDHPLTLSN